MLKDAKAGRMFSLLHQNVPVAEIARTLHMGERTIRKYRDKGILPSQQPRPPRTYRTRPDPLEAYWPEIEAFLEADPRLKPVALLDWLKQKYNDPETGEGPVSDSIRRTLERRVQKWKLDHGVQQEVTFPQVHHAGDVIAFDFVNLNGLGITIGGRPFDHLLFHAVFTFSNWEHVHLCHSESFEALSAGLQDALHLAGGVPRRVRSDSLSAAVNNLSSDKQFAKQYQALLDHYGVKGHRINVRKPHENGDVESAHGHLKTWLDQSLRLRGHRDFENVAAYQDFLRQVVTRKNAGRASAFQRESAALDPLPRPKAGFHHEQAGAGQIGLRAADQTQLVFGQQQVRRLETRRRNPSRPFGTVASRPSPGVFAEAVWRGQRTHRLSAPDRFLDSKAGRVRQLQIREASLSHDSLPHGLRSTDGPQRGKTRDQAVSENPACRQARRLGRRR